MTNVGQFFTLYGAIEDGNIWLGDQTFSTTTTEKPKAYWFSPTSGPYIWFDKATSEFGWASATSGAEFVWNSGGTSFDPIPPLTLISGESRLSTTTYWWLLDDNNALVGTTSTIALGTASGTALDDFWNSRQNASTTKNSYFAFSDDLRILGNATTTGNATVTGSFNVTGDWCIDGTCFSSFPRVVTSTAIATTDINLSTTSTVKFYTIPAGEAVKGTVYHATYGSTSGGGGELFHVVPIINGTYLNNFQECLLASEVPGVVEFWVVVGSDDNMEIHGTCSSWASPAAYLASNRATYAQNSTTVKFATENITFGIAAWSRNGGNDAHVLTSTGWLVIRY